MHLLGAMQVTSLKTNVIAWVGSERFLWDFN